MALLANPVTFAYAVWDSARPGYVSGESMEPTRWNGELTFANTWRYRLGAPARGDVVVVRGPQTDGQSFLKRVVGTPGETIEVVGEAVIVDGRALPEPYVRAPWSGEIAAVRLGPGEYFVMGDNRERSYDSRSFGAVPREAIVAPDAGVFWPLDRAEAGPLAAAALIVGVALTASVAFAIASAGAVRGRWARARAARNGLCLWGVGYALAVREGGQQMEPLAGRKAMPAGGPGWTPLLPIASAVIGASAAGGGWMAVGGGLALAVATGAATLASWRRGRLAEAVALAGSLQFGWLLLFVPLWVLGAPAEDAGLIALLAPVAPLVLRLFAVRSGRAATTSIAWRERDGWRWIVALLTWATVASLFLGLDTLPAWTLAGSAFAGMCSEGARQIREGRWVVKSLGFAGPLAAAGLAAVVVPGDLRLLGAAVGVLLAATLLVLARRELETEAGRGFGAIAREP